MTVYDFTRNWTVEADGRPATAVTLPHDAMIHERRDRRCRNGANTGYFPGGVYTYRKTFAAPGEWRDRHVSLFFEGAYHRSTVSLNGHVVGGRPSGYAAFRADLGERLVHGAGNEVVVVVDTTGEPNGRWYSGSGLYRPVWLEVDGPVHIARDGICVRTPAVNGPAEVEVRVSVDQAAPAGDAAVDLVVQLLADGLPVAGSAAPAPPGEIAEVVTRLSVPDPRLWSADSPFLYELVVLLQEGGQVIDERRQLVGLRTVSVDAVHGLRINGVPVNLRGACVHHDSGVLGAATFRAAEMRRARILKETGFNAVRSAHTPMARSFLDACDEVGLYVIDELTDVWFVPKTAHDYAQDFRVWWRADLESMVVKSRNHPSVVMYSIGNENSETATPEGIAVGRAMAGHCRELDPTRPVTAGVNLMLNGLATVGISAFKAEEPAGTTGAARPERGRARGGKRDDKEMPAVGSAFFNLLYSRIGPIMNHVGRLGRVDRATSGIFQVLDVAGYNYGAGSYRVTGRRHPGRVVVGTETLPGDIVRNWQQVEELPYVIGDFMWTGWDYLGEAGVAAWSYGPDRKANLKRYPYLLAAAGAVDIIGLPGAMAFHAQAAWGQRDEPAIVVRPLDRIGQSVLKSPWRTTDGIASWSWTGYEGTETEVVVFSAADSVELLLNGHSLGTRPAGRDHDCMATFRVTYEPGELTAVAHASTGAVTGRSSLISAGPDVRLRLRSDRVELRGDGQDLAFVEVELTDAASTVVPLSGVALQAQVEGAGTLAGFGSADPKPLDSYTNGLHSTCCGRALAVIRAGTDPGAAMLTVASDGFGEQRVTVDVRAGTSEGYL